MPAPSPQLSNFNRPFDALLQLQDDAAAITASGNGTVGGSARIVDIGEGVVFSEAVFDVNSLDVAGGDELYRCQIQGSTSASFASGVVVLGELLLGDSSTTGESADSAITLTKRFQVPFWNVKYGVAFRYIRVRFVMTGATVSLDAECYLTQVR
jgi:hypothetical protein